MKNYKKIITVLTLIFLLFTSLPTIHAEEKKELQDFSLMLDWYPNANHIPIYVALAEGYFEEEGLNVTINMPAEADDPIKLVSVGQTDLAISYPPVLIQAAAEDMPVKAIGSLVQSRLDAVIYKKDSGIKSPKDLMGKKVGYSATTISENITQAMIENDGGDFKKTEMINVGWDLIPALSTDNVDAIIGGYINHELLLLEKEGFAVESIDYTKYGVPDTDELIFVAGDSTIKEKPEEIKAFMRAVSKGYKKATEDPDKALETLFSNEQNDYVLDKEIEKKSWEMLQKYMVGKGEFGTLIPENYKKFADFLYDFKTISKELSAEDLVHDLSH